MWEPYIHTHTPQIDREVTYIGIRPTDTRSGVEEHTKHIHPLLKYLVMSLIVE